MMNGPAPSAASNEVRKTSEMESLCRRLGDTLMRLREVNDRSTATVARFCNEPQPASPPVSGSAQIMPAAPPPGTLGCLGELADKIEHEAMRAFNNAKRQDDLIG